MFQYVCEGIRRSNLFISDNSPPFRRPFIRSSCILKGESSTPPHSIPRISLSGYPPLYPRPSYPTIHRGRGRSSGKHSASRQQPAHIHFLRRRWRRGRARGVKRQLLRNTSAAFFHRPAIWHLSWFSLGRRYVSFATPLSTARQVIFPVEGFHYTSQRYVIAQRRLWGRDKCPIRSGLGRIN